MLETIRKNLEDKFRITLQGINSKARTGDYLPDIEYDFDNFTNLEREEKYHHKYIDPKKKEELSPEDNYYYLIQNELSAAYNSFGNKSDSASLSLKQIFRYVYFQDKIHRCCFCGQLLEKTSKNETEYSISTIEHIFPKSKFPQYALCIDNWAPCCSECNSAEKGNNFFVGNAKHKFYKAIMQLGILKNFAKKPLEIWRHVSFDFSSLDANILINGKPKCSENKEAFQLLDFYGLDKRYKTVKKGLYNNLFNIIKHHKINSPEALENFLECCLSSNMQEMISDFSINNYPKIWNDFLDYILYDYNNLSALWDELKEYNKLAYFS